MKNIVFISLLLLICLTTYCQQSYSEQYSLKVVERMKDSLVLSEAAKVKVYNINLELQNEKAAIWKQYSDPDMIQMHLQNIENKRDLLYSSVLNNNQFILYKQKKKNVISNN
jgi:hypothetical protein